MRITIATLAFLAAGPVIAQDNAFAGRYSTVSESEWEVKVDLKPNQSATLEIVRWEPGERDKPKTKRYRGSWSVSGSDVSLNFKEGTATFRIEPQLSFAEFQRKGVAPGLVGKSASFERSMIVNSSLWLESELMKLKW
jgi:hypothetical protein